MKSVLVFIFASCVYSISSQGTEENILCTEAFCNTAVCSTLPDNCNIQNATHNGIFLPSPDFCNCCEYCLVNLNEGDECSSGNPSSPSHTSICGPQLYCKLRDDSDFDGYCSRMETECLQKQDDYDNRRRNGTLGSMELRQDCDDEGLYASYKCIPGQTCYCLSKNGTRIFGEADFTGIPAFIMQCQCSRDYEEATELLGKELVPSEHFRCSANGDYDAIQCIGEQCLCVDTSDGAPTYPDDQLVNLTLISNETLKCYHGEEVGVFYRKCEAEYIEILTEVKKYKEDGFDMVFAYKFPNCDVDGTYKAVQENSTHKMCVDKEGTVLTAVDKIENGNLADSMNCKCVRALSVISSREKPTCDLNGNYTPIQCRRGTCRCVDGDGNQICDNAACEVDENDKDTLNCPQ